MWYKIYQIFKSFHTFTNIVFNVYIYISFFIYDICVYVDLYL